MNVRTLCLGVLQLRDATGYEIKKMVEEGMFNHFIEASYGSIYPALTRMSQDGLVTCRREIQSGKPDKKVYSITPAGRAELMRTLSATPSDDKFKSEFLFIMLLADLLPCEHIAGIYGQRIARMRAELEDLHACAAQCERNGSRFVVGYGIAICEASLKYLEEHRDILTETEDADAARLPLAAGAAE